jgi:hypothetical protein
MLQFSPETIQHLRAVLDDASAEIQADSPTKALMAEHILRTAATGVRGYEKLRDAAVEIARCDAACIDQVSQGNRRAWNMVV